MNIQSQTFDTNQETLFSLEETITEPTLTIKDEWSDFEIHLYPYDGIHSCYRGLSIGDQIMQQRSKEKQKSEGKQQSKKTTK